MNKEELKNNKWKLEFYKDMDLTRQYIIDAIQNLKDGNIELAKDRLNFISLHLNTFLSDYDQFIYEERMKSLD